MFPPDSGLDRVLLEQQRQTCNLRRPLGVWEVSLGCGLRRWVSFYGSMVEPFAWDSGARRGPPQDSWVEVGERGAEGAWSGAPRLDGATCETVRRPALLG